MTEPNDASPVASSHQEQPRWLRWRVSRLALAGAGLVWIAGVAGVVRVAMRPDLPWWLGALMLGWLFLLPGVLGLWFGRWAWLAPVVAGLSLFAWMSPDALVSTLGNLALPAAIFALLPAAALTGMGVAIWATPADDEPDEASGSLLAEAAIGE
jgi:O-antigen ligase